MDALSKEPLISPNFTVHSHNQNPEESQIAELTKNYLFSNPIAAEKPQHEWGEVLVLIGTSTAGKTTLITRLIKENPQMIERGIDAAFTDISFAFLNENKEKEMDYLREIIEPDSKNHSYLDYVFGKEPVFKENVSEEKKKSYAETINILNEYLKTNLPSEKISSIMLDQIVLESKKGSSVVLDVLHVRDVSNHVLTKELPQVTLALVYVPLQTLAKRIVNRNHEAEIENNLNNARAGLFPLEQFAQIFRPKQSDQDEVVQRLTFKEAKNAIDSVYENGKAFLDKHKLPGIEDLEHEKANSFVRILKKLGFNEDDDPDKVVELTPKYKGYDILLNTDQTTKSDLAKILIKKNLKKN